MDINLPLKVEVENEIFFKELDLQNKDLVERLKAIAYGDFPKLDDFILDYLKKDERQIIEAIRVSIALKLGLETLK